MSTSLVQVRVDTEMRDDANKLFESLGLDMSTAIKIFLKKCLAEDGIPFEVKAKRNGRRSTEGLIAMMELQKEAEENGLSDISIDEINAEIKAARKARKERE